MRDIIFKGKRKDNSEWVEGYLFDDDMVDSNRMFIGSLVITEHKGMGEDVWDIGHAFYEVIPETIGQYTGLTDKNGKKIFEGDLLEWIDRIVAVVWFDFNAQFDSKFIRYCNDKIVTNFKGIEPSDWHECKVIGNVFDNPELLEVK